MLPSGIEVLGFFVFCSSSEEKNTSLKKLTSVMSRMFAPDENEDDEDDNTTETGIDTSNRYEEPKEKENLSLINVSMHE